MKARGIRCWSCGCGGSGGAAVPITRGAGEDARQLIVSGPNTGGKTVALKTVACWRVMAQAGLPVPAESATLPLFARDLCGHRRRAVD